MDRTKIKQCILFDWGNTLMREFDEYPGKMVDWPRVEAVPYADEVLASLRPNWRLVVATNARSSDEKDIRGALRRVKLETFVDAIYCFRNIGFRKPSPEFFASVLENLEVSTEQAVMVGDDFQVDVLGAVSFGMRAIWYNFKTLDDRSGEGYMTIHDLQKLPEAIEQLFDGGVKPIGFSTIEKQQR